MGPCFCFFPFGQWKWKYSVAGSFFWKSTSCFVSQAVLLICVSVGVVFVVVNILFLLFCCVVNVVVYVLFLLALLTTGQSWTFPS